MAIAFEPKLWRAVGVAVCGVALSACGERAPETLGGPVGIAAPAAPSPGVGGEGEGGEVGEAGAADAYAGLEGAARTALRRQHLKGFLLLAERLAREGDAAGAQILALQGVVEVADPAPDAFAGVDLASLRAAADAADASGFAAALRRALAEVDAAQAADGATSIETVRRMLALTRGLYGMVNAPEGVDPIEYQHSLGAALAAADALDQAARSLEDAPLAEAREAAAELERLIALWPASTAPEAPAPLSKVAAQASRAELALPRS